MGGVALERTAQVAVGDNASQRAIDELLDGMRAVFPAARWTDDIQPWAGLRPSTPTGLPIYGAMKTPGLYMNAGHGALGLTLAAGSARRLAAAMSGVTVAV